MIVEFETAILLLIAAILGLIFLKQRDCEERVRTAANEGERRMLAAIRITMDYLLTQDDTDEDDNKD